MALFFFALEAEDTLFPALETQGDCTFELVRREACTSAKQGVARALITGSPLSDALKHTFEIRDEAGVIVLKIPFAEAVEVDTTPSHS